MYYFKKIFTQIHSTAATRTHEYINTWFVNTYKRKNSKSKWPYKLTLLVISQEKNPLKVMGYESYLLAGALHTLQGF